MSLAPPSINPASLYKEEAKRDATRIKIYNGVLTQIYNKIKAIARIPGNEKALWYLIPEFLPGYPRFDPGDAVLYIVWNLRNTGYKVEYTHPNLLYVTWKAYDERYHKVDSPWSQVLNSAKAHTQEIEPQQTEKSIEIGKRKTILKKTVEYQPMTQNQTQHFQPPLEQKGIQLPGQLSQNHVSFV